MKKIMFRASLMVILALAVTGCKKDEVEGPFKGMSKAEIVEMYTDLEKDYYDLEEEYNAMDELYNGIQSENLPSSAIGITGDGTGRFTFNSFDSKIIFPSSFQYPDSIQTTSNGSVSIVDNINIRPGTNWIMKLNGTTLELEHSSGISGTIKVGEQSYIYSAEELQTEVLSQWFVGLPPSNITYSNISVEDKALGSQAVTPTIIDSEDAYLRCGMVAKGNYAITYVFVYRGTKDSNKDESIANLLNTITINNNKIIVEQ